MRKKRGISQVISAVIIASISITLIIAFLSYAIVTLETASQQAEFERAKSLMKTLAEETIYTVLTGVGAEIRFPSRTLRLNFLTLNSELKLTVSYNGTYGNITTIDNGILAVTCFGGEFVSGENEVIYGLRENLPFVEDMYLLPLAQTFWNVSEGRVSVSINFTRLVYQEFEYSDTLVIELSYINVNWEMESGASGEILEIKYLGSEMQTLYNKFVTGSVDLSFSLMLNGEVIDIPRTREAVSGCNLIIRVIIHNVLYKVR